MTKISIVIPTFNSERFLQTCINSILNQEYKNYEVIICDNCSTDNTIKIIKKIIKNNKKFKIFIRKDKGVADALNFGFKQSTGTILCWLNSDDLYAHSLSLMLVVKKFIKNVNKSYLIGNFINIDTKGNNIKKFYSYKPLFKMKRLFFYNQIFTGSFFFKNKVFKDFKLFNIKNKLSFEYEILIHILKNYEGIYLNNFLSKFRIVPYALSSNKKLLKNEFEKILKINNLIYSNSIILRIFCYIKQGILVSVLISRVKEYYNLKI